VNQRKPKPEVAGLENRWRLLAELPAGRHAQVWVAEDLELSDQVVIKVFPACDDAAVRARALVEISLGQRLRHPHLVGLHDVVEIGQNLVAVMEWMSGGSLSQRVRLGGEQSLDLVVRWTGQILDVLGYLHDRHLVHRDVKPSNLLLDADDDLKLGDLGLVGRFDRGRYLPATRTAIGTPGYMAPEQRTDKEPSPSWDLYALGVTMTQLATGWRPAVGSATGYGDGECSVPPISSLRPGCPLWFEQFVEKLASYRALDRWPTAREALEVFEVQRSS
jgi:serine/threonine protein kinase